MRDMTADDVSLLIRAQALAQEAIELWEEVCEDTENAVFWEQNWRSAVRVSMLTGKTAIGAALGHLREKYVIQPVCVPSEVP